MKRLKIAVLALSLMSLSPSAFALVDDAGGGDKCSAEPLHLKENDAYAGCLTKKDGTERYYSKDEMDAFTCTNFCKIVWKPKSVSEE